MSIEDNKRVLCRWLEEFWNQGNEQTAAELLSDEIIDAPSGSQRVAPGAEALRNFVRGWRRAFPDGRMTIEDMISEGDRVAARLTWRGTHAGDFMGLPPTQKRIEVTIMAFERIRDGKIVQGWGEANMLGLLQQIGAVGSIGQLKAPEPTAAQSESPAVPADEVRAFVDLWLRKLDEHAPAAELLELAHATNFEARFPTGERQARSEFAQFYERSLKVFTDERHEVRGLEVRPHPEGVEVLVSIRWQARRAADGAAGELLARDTRQRWLLHRRPGDGRLVLLRYVIESATPIDPHAAS